MIVDGSLIERAGGVAVRAAWRRTLAVFGASLLAMLALYGDTAAAMAAIWWRSDTYAHGMLVAPIVVYMLATRREELARLTPHPAWGGVMALLALACGWAFAGAAEVGVVQQFALVMMIPALVWALMGAQLVRAAAFPLAYLLFAVPVGESLVVPLQDFTAAFTVRALQFTGIPVFWEGHFITIPSGNFEVAEACSGIRYLIASAALGCLYAYLSYRALWRRLAFILLALVLPVIANGIRAYGIVMIAHLSDMKLATGVDHIVYGWLFFGLVVLFMFWLGRLWMEPLAAAPAPVAAVAGGPLRPPFTAAGLALLALAVGLLLALRVAHVAPVAVPALAAPQVPGWQDRGPAADWTTHYPGAARELKRRYVAGDGGARVELFVAAYAGARGDGTLVSSTNLVYDPAQWIHAGDARLELATPQGPLVLHEQRLIHGDARRTVWYWYQLGARTETRPVVAKLLQAREALAGRSTVDAVVAVATEADADPQLARVRLEHFLVAALPGIRQALGNGG